MKKVKKLIVGNWKMNPIEQEDAKKIVAGVKRTALNLKNSEVVVCPPFVYTSLFSKGKSKNFNLGAQNVNPELSGSFTGEVSYSMLYQFGVRFVIVGHSERRKMGESDALVNKKVNAVINSGMTAILCVGESTRDHNGDYLEFIKNQIRDALNDVPKKLMGNIVIAYEPIWAVGATQAMSSMDLHEMSIYIKKVLKDLFGVYSNDTRILYGGSVDLVNAEGLVRDGNVSGLLIGRESLKPAVFSEIVKTVDRIK